MSTCINDLNIPDFERVVRVDNDDLGLLGIIAIHNTKRGPALGGIRYRSFDYANVNPIREVCNLAQAMTNKNALAELNYGGGKAVICQTSDTDAHRADVYRAMGEAIERLGGAYVACEDVSTVTDDLHHVLENTSFCGGVSVNSGLTTAIALRHVFTMYRKQEGLTAAQTHVALAGLGKVGYNLGHFLYQDGMTLTVSDINEEVMNDFRREHPGTAVGAPELMAGKACEVYSPCALGGTLSAQTRIAMNCNAVIGSANNQLDSLETARILHNRGVHYFPDYLVNAGGVIGIAAELDNEMDLLQTRLMNVAVRAENIWNHSQRTNRCMLQVCQNMVLELLR